MKKNRKKIFITAMFLAMSAFSFAEGEDYSDYKALLIGDANGNIIKEDNANTVRPLASITKVMTTILTFDKLKNGQISYDDQVTVSNKASKIPYGIQLKAGKQYSVRDLLKATIVKSSNSAAYALAEYVGGDVSSFVGQMNSKARQFGLNSLRYCSPNGLPPSYTGSCMDQGNAKDLYKLATITVNNYSEFLDFSKNSVTYIGNGDTKLTSTNTLLGKVTGLDGLKTGYHDAAGSNIILTADRGGDRVIAVILGSNKAKDRNAIGMREINDYYANGYGRKNNKNSNKNADNNTNNPEKKNGIQDFFGSLFGNNHKDGSRKIRVVNKRDVIAVVKIGNEKYNLYPTQDIEITATEKPNLTYNVTLQDGVNKDSRGKIVGKYTATDGKIEVSGDLIMR
nr:D-alanyl-D-alanine carboxypeptidase family protein [uncultured Leptotrichia sp.]